MTKKRKSPHHVNQPGPKADWNLFQSDEQRSDGDVLDENTTLDLFVSSMGFVTELSDTVDVMDGAAVEVVDIVNEADGTNIELTLVEEATDNPNLNSIDRFVEIKGIGPEVARLLTQAGIRRFSDLAETPVERIRDILSVASSHYRIHDAITWPEQARQLARENPNRASSPSTRQPIGRA